MSEDELKRLGELIQKRRKVEYGTKSAAYKAADLNSATWDRAEAGKPIREDRMTAVLRVLFGIGSTPESVLARADNAWSGIETAGPGLEDPDTDTADLAAWAEENFRRVNDALAELADAVERLERRAGSGDAAFAAEKSDDAEGGSGLRIVTSPDATDSSEPDESLPEAALETDDSLDEEPGGSDQ